MEIKEFANKDPEPLSIDHIGFCMSNFDVTECRNCPTLKECLSLYGKDQVVKVLEAMKIAKKIRQEDEDRKLDVLEVMAECTGYSNVEDLYIQGNTFVLDSCSWLDTLPDEEEGYK